MMSAQCSPGNSLVAWLHAEEQPLLAAAAAMERWVYIRTVADAAMQGQVVDCSLPQVLANPAMYATTSGEMIAALSGWLDSRVSAAG